jgi:hypothetical protein
MNRRPRAHQRAATKNEGEEVADAEDERPEERVGSARHRASPSAPKMVAAAAEEEEEESHRV